ncbi:MAG: lipoyl(octanoyl) transferase LipB [Verrucomicrobia bacterium]|nr:lipoyl(octanoyl) transferase LipB [Verrucomicrobiota bacterium]
MRIEWLGRIEYQTGLQIQNERLESCLDDGVETVILLEHEPVYTIGRLPDKSSLRNADRLPYPVFEINRGGQATYHGPGQLVGYPILDLRLRGRDLHHYLRELERLLIGLLADFGIRGASIEGKTGVWIEDRKIASIGVGVRKWVTMHGFALNVASELRGFESITPCGISGVRMTSISSELEREISLETVREKLVPHLYRHLEPASLTNL